MNLIKIKKQKLESLKRNWRLIKMNKINRLNNKEDLSLLKFDKKLMINKH
jgi:hypothetical protein